MKLWRWVLLLLVIAALVAFGWHWAADDPGYVYVQWHGWYAERTVVTAILTLLLFWVVLSTVWWLIRWPFGAFSRRHRRVSRQRMNEGLIALAEGRHGDAERARQALEPLQKSGAFGTRAYNALESKILVATLSASPDGATLNTLWSQLPKAQRRVPAIIDAYARRAAGFGLILPAMDEVESALRREWSPLLIETYGTLGNHDIDARLRRAEGWLNEYPNDASLLLTLGRMCLRLKLWSKAQTYLQRVLALAPSASVWEALGDLHAGQGNDALASRCYRNALAFARGEVTDPLPLNPNRNSLTSKLSAFDAKQLFRMARV
jgi:HemY protein